jgi:hypothetical protein
VYRVRAMRDCAWNFKCIVKTYWVCEKVKYEMLMQTVSKKIVGFFENAKRARLAEGGRKLEVE